MRWYTEGPLPRGGNTDPERATKISVIMLEWGVRTRTDDEGYQESTSFFRTNQCLTHRLVLAAFLLIHPDFRI